MNETTQDWRTIDVSTPEGLRALDWEIAQRQGWTIRHGFSGALGTNGYVIRDAVGKRIYLARETDEGLGFLESPRVEEALPHYTTDLNLAWSLIGDLETAGISRCNDDYPEGKPFVASFPLHNYDEEMGFSFASTPALACCFAFLERDDARKREAQP